MTRRSQLTAKSTASSNPASGKKIRLDKWLWAARFFKNRSQAKQAIDGGKVQYNGARSKVSKEVEVGATLLVRQGWDDREVEIIALADQRRGASEAQMLYRETAASITRREAAAGERKALRSLDLAGQGRPSKKQRRQIHRFRGQQD